MIKNLFSRPEFLQDLIYLLKCLLGVIVCYILYKEIPQYPFYWAIVSVVLALSPDNTNKQAYTRIKANVFGCAVGLCLYPLNLPNLLILCVGVAIIIGIGIYLKITDVLRTALAALIIVMIQAEQTKHWYIALERVICVVAGCLVALILTLVFSLITLKLLKHKMPAS